MAFKLYSTDDGHVPGWEYLTSGAIKPQVGLGVELKPDTGKLGVSQVPNYIIMRTEEATVNEGTVLPAVKITEDQVWESRLYSAATSAKVGMKVDLSESGLWVDATKTSKGNFLITYLEGTYKNSLVRGRFVPEKAATTASS